VGKKQALGGFLDVLINSKETSNIPAETTNTNNTMAKWHNGTIAKSEPKEKAKETEPIRTMAIKLKGTKANPSVSKTLKQKESKKAKRHNDTLAKIKAKDVLKPENSIKAKEQNGTLAQRHIDTKHIVLPSIKSQKTSDIKRFVAHIDYDVYNAVKKDAIKSNKSISDYVTNSILENLKKDIKITDSKNNSKKYGLTLYIPATLFTDLKLKACDIKVPFNKLIESILK